MLYACDDAIFTATPVCEQEYVSPNVVRADERREAQLEAKRKSKKVKESKAARRELKEEKTTLDKVFDDVCSCCDLFIDDKFNMAMNKYNRKN